MAPAHPALIADEPMTPAQILFSLRGRVPRRTWWLWGVAALILAGILFTVLLGVAGVDPWHAEMIVNLLLLWPSIAVSAKRWHDRDKSGWWVLLWALPVIGWIWALIDNGFVRGSVGANRHGDDLTGRL